MDYSVTEKAGTQTVEMTGRLTFADHQRFRNLIGNFQSGQVRVCEFNMAGVEFVDSSAMGMLLLARETAIAHNVELIIKGAQKGVRSVMEIAKFDKLFRIVN